MFRGLARTARVRLTKTSLPPEWVKTAEKELKGKATPESLVFDTAEGVEIKPIYTADDTKDLQTPPLPQEGYVGV